MRRRGRLLVAIVLLGCGAGARQTRTTADESDRHFWRWFARNAARVAIAHPSDVLASDEVHRELHRVDSDLDFDLPRELSGGDRQLVITAGGKREAFPAVERLVAAAPEIPGWRIVAFQPRAPSASRLVVASKGFSLDSERVLYDSRPEGGGLAITLYLDGYDRGDQQLPDAALVLLERLLGEVDLATQIAWIDFRPAIEAPPRARPLRLLRNEVDRRKNRPEPQSSRRRTISASLPAS